MGLEEVFKTGKSRRIGSKYHARCRRRLDVLDSAVTLNDLRIPGFELHELNGKPVRWAIRINGPWRITFEWREGDAYRVNFENYH